MDFEHQARMTKARKIAEYCRTENIRPELLIHDELPTITAALRTTICINANVNEASAETWAVVIGLLGATSEMTETQRAAYETAAHGEGGDPFAGLPS